MKEDLKASETPGSRSFSTSARTQEEAIISFEESDIEVQGHKFGLPELPLPPFSHLKYRYDPLIEQVTKLLMQHGKLARAQRVGAPFQADSTIVVEKTL